MFSRQHTVISPRVSHCRSKGYGFLEFKEHLHALAALRQLNNNPAYSKYAAGGGATSKKPEERPRLIVEFTVENWREVKKQEDKRVRQRERAKMNAAAGVGIAQPKVSETASVRTEKTGKSAAPKESSGRRVSFDPEITKSKSTKKESKPQKPTSEAAVSGKKRGRNDMSTSKLDPELDELAALADSGDAKKPRRAAKKREKAEEADHDRMVNDYKKKLFKAPAAGKGPAVGAGAAADMSKWM
jgi:nucleolar protein 4